VIASTFPLVNKLSSLPYHPGAYRRVGLQFIAYCFKYVDPSAAICVTTHVFVAFQLEKKSNGSRLLFTCHYDKDCVKQKFNDYDGASRLNVISVDGSKQKKTKSVNNEGTCPLGFDSSEAAHYAFLSQMTAYIYPWACYLENGAMEQVPIVRIEVSTTSK
jgi:hypothetical protein